MARRAWIAGFSLSFLGACNWVDGACWLKSEENAGSGAGGGPIAPVGGGFGDVPDPTPQAAGDPPPPPECLQVPQGQCYQKCLADYEAAAARCGNIEGAAERLACQNAAYAAYKTCRDKCRQQEDDHKEKCIDMYDVCMSKGEPCTKVIDAGKTLCAFCLGNCIDKEPYKYSQCYSCGFECPCPHRLSRFR